MSMDLSISYIEPSDITELSEVPQVFTVILDMHLYELFHFITLVEPVLLKPKLLNCINIKELLGSSKVPLTLSNTVNTIPLPTI